MAAIPTSTAVVALPIATTISTASHAQQAKPNILVIFGDDIGIANVSAYSDGVMGCGLLKNLGYATGQFGKNQVGDRNDTLPAALRPVVRKLRKNTSCAKGGH